MMSRNARIAAAVAALLLVTLYLLPMWYIRLGAPQYPEGLGLDIWIDRITGLGPNDLQNINGLNHYIGMKRITPEDIPELRFMPIVVAGLIALGMLVAATGRRWLLHAWAGVFVLVALAGLYDFWRWEYDYGHNLDPTAAIRIPGMSYQPPLLGTKQLLNFVATSLPGPAGWAALAALALVLAAVVLEWRRARAARSGPEAGNGGDGAPLTLIDERAVARTPRRAGRSQATV